MSSWASCRPLCRIELAVGRGCGVEDLGERPLDLVVVVEDLGRGSRWGNPTWRLANLLSVPLGHHDAVGRPLAAPPGALPELHREMWN